MNLARLNLAHTCQQTTPPRSHSQLPTEARKLSRARDGFTRPLTLDTGTPPTELDDGEMGWLGQRKSDGGLGSFCLDMVAIRPNNPQRVQQVMSDVDLPKLIDGAHRLNTTRRRVARKNLSSRRKSECELSVKCSV